MQQAVPEAGRSTTSPEGEVVDLPRCRNDVWLEVFSILDEKWYKKAIKLLVWDNNPWLVKKFSDLFIYLSDEEMCNYLEYFSSLGEWLSKYIEMIYTERPSMPLLKLAIDKDVAIFIGKKKS